MTPRTRFNSTLRASTKPMKGSPLARTCTLARTPLRPRSAKKARTDRELSKLTRQLIAERGDRCQLRTRVCTGRAEGTHHKRKRSQGGKHTRENILLSCNACNGYVEDQAAEAERAGLVDRRSKHDPITPVRGMRGAA